MTRVMEAAMILEKEIVRQMFNAGESFEKIAQYTGYEVCELKKMLEEV